MKRLKAERKYVKMIKKKWLYVFWKGKLQVSFLFFIYFQVF